MAVVAVPKALRKSAEQHLADAKAIPVEGIEVIGPAKQFNGSEWFVNVRCLHCGKQKWIRKNLIKKTTHCGCQSLRNRRKEKEMKETPKMDTTKVELTEDQKKEIDKTLGHEETVTVPRRLAEAMAKQLQALWCETPFWEMPPVIFERLKSETEALYKSLNGVKK